MIGNWRNRVMYSPAAAVVLSMLLAGMATAQDVLSPKLNLEVAVSKALETDPQRRASETRSELAAERINEARTRWQPTVRFEQSLSRTNNPVGVFSSLLEQGRFTASNFSLNSLNEPNGLNNFRSSVLVRAPILDQRQSRSQIHRAKIERNKAGLQIEEVSQKLRFDVITKYFGAILAGELLNATVASVRSARENARKTQDFVEVGMVAESDSLVANVELANVEQQNLEAVSAVVRTRAALNIAIGESPAVKYQLVGNLQERYFQIEDEAELIRVALEQRPDYLRAELAVEDERVKTGSIKNEKLPRLDAFGNFAYNSPFIGKGSTDYTVGLSLSYTIFDPGRKSRLVQARLSESLAVAEQERLEDQVTLDVITACQNYRTARAKIQVSIKSVFQAEEALRILQYRYRSAISTFDAVLRSEAMLLRANHELLKAKYEYYISYASILLATGRLTDVRAFEN